MKRDLSYVCPFVCWHQIALRGNARGGVPAPLLKHPARSPEPQDGPGRSMFRSGETAMTTCFENLIRFDCVAESHNVSANGRANILFLNVVVSLLSRRASLKRRASCSSAYCATGSSRDGGWRPILILRHQLNVLRRALRLAYYNEVPTHVSLGKDAPCTRAIE